jgi:hypothetical protein
MKRLLIFYMVFILIWFGGAMIASHFITMDAVSALGIGTAGGVFVSKFGTIIDKITG